MLFICPLGNDAFLQVRKLALGDSSLVVAAGMSSDFTQKPSCFLFPHLLLNFLVQSQPFSFPHPSWGHLPANHTAYDSLEAGGRTDGCLCSFQTAGNKCELLARTQLSQGLRPSGEGQGGSEVAFVSGITLHMPQGLPTQVSVPSNSHPAPKTPGANASIPSCRTSRSQRGEEASTTSLPFGSTDDFGLVKGRH